ncbi:MAG: DUF4340 domain-containing protein [Lewinellaceae bacterium]|nr:DUF4340 domain-containing protein [Saprospiraceae bacterium]MCB9316847.1 DUF4340 domain-containing protein [Lewinellaceae bacterium]MCB9332133.1 DUF4340 domain-containing protein [Lewinellaceae bacterium]
MKRTGLLVALFLLLGVAAFYVLRQKNTQSGSHVSWDMDFAVKNTEDITRIFLADRGGQRVTLERKDGFWLYNGKYVARPTAVQTLLETIQNINVLYIPPKAAESSMVTSLATEGITVEVYGKNNERLKRYYVGGVTNDERGTYVIMEGAEQPYVAHVPGFIGQLRARFILKEDDWRDRTVFSEKPEEIQFISVEYPQQKSESFQLEKMDKATYSVKPLFSTTPVSPTPQRKGVAEAYLLQFEKLGAEGFETTNPLRDSVRALVPFAIVKLQRTDSTMKEVRFWPVAIEENYATGQHYINRYFTDLNNGDAFLLTQERVFGKIFRGYNFFFGRKEKPRLQN